MEGGGWWAGVEAEGGGRRARPSCAPHWGGVRVWRAGVEGGCGGWRARPHWGGRGVVSGWRVKWSQLAGAHRCVFAHDACECLCNPLRVEALGGSN